MSASGSEESFRFVADMVSVLIWMSDADNAPEWAWSYEARPEVLDLRGSLQLNSQSGD